jgi:hypothetical protein
MTQIQAIQMAERALSKAPTPGVFAIPFANRRDYDRADDAFTDMGCLTGEYLSPRENPPFHEAFRSVDRLIKDNGPQTELYVLQVAVPSPKHLKIDREFADCR